MMQNHDEQDESIGRRRKVDKPFIISMSRVTHALDIRVESSLANILDNTKAKLRIEIGADNMAIVTVVDEISGDRIGTLGDIEKIAKFKRFIEEEKKISKNLDILGPIEGRLVNAFKKLIATKEWANMSFPNIRAEQIVALKESERKTRRLETNRIFLEDYIEHKCKNVDESHVAKIIHGWIIGSLEVNAKLYEWTLTGADSVKRLSDEVFAQLIPAWAYKRLSQMNIALATDMRRVVFPQNTRAGLQFTVRELFHIGFRNRHVALLASSGFQLRLLADAEGLQKALNLSITPNLADVKSLEKADLLWLLDAPVLISPRWYGIEFLFEPKAKGRVPDFDPPKYSTPQSTLKSIVNMIVSMQVFEFRTDQQIGEVWDKLSTGLGINGVFRENISAKNNLYRVALTQSKLIEQRVRGIVECHGRAAKEFMIARTRAQLKTTKGSDLEKIIFKHLGLDNIDQKGSTIVASSSYPPPEGRSRAEHFLALCEPTKVADAAILKEVQQNIGIRKMSQKRADRQYGIEVTKLSKEAVTFLEQLKIKRSTQYLVQGIENWLKSFVHENFQAAGLKQAQLNLPDYVKDDSSSSEQDSDDDM